MSVSSPVLATPARRFACEVLRSWRERSGYAREIFDAKLPLAALSAQDAAFARTLVLGVVSHMGTLDELIDGVLDSPKDVKPKVRDALRVSAYELFFMDKAAHAAVNEGVALVAEVAPRARGVANFVLRRLSEVREDFPFGDPMTDCDALSRLFGFPRWLVDELLSTGDSLRDVAFFMKASNEPAPVFFTVNAIHAEDDDVIAALASAGVDSAPGGVDEATFGKLPVSYCHRLMNAEDVGNPAFLNLVKRGEIIISDAAAQAVAFIALPKEASASMLEIGAGRGTKTLLIQSNAQRCFGHPVSLTSIDNRNFKADLLRSRLETYGVTGTEVLAADATALDAVFPGRTFDAVFIDAPCSGLGTLRRHPEIRWRLTPEDIVALADLGLSLLMSASRHLSAGGIITYATCTNTVAETTELVERFLASPNGVSFRIRPQTPDATYFCTKLSPGSADAHFAVCLERCDE